MIWVSGGKSTPEFLRLWSKRWIPVAGVEGGLSTGKHREEGEPDLEEVELPEAAKQRRRSHSLFVA